MTFIYIFTVKPPGGMLIYISLYVLVCTHPILTDFLEHIGTQSKFWCWVGCCHKYKPKISFAKISASHEEDSLHTRNFGNEAVIRGSYLINFISTILLMVMESPCTGDSYFMNLITKIIIILTLGPEKWVSLCLKMNLLISKK